MKTHQRIVACALIVLIPVIARAQDAEPEPAVNAAEVIGLDVVEQAGMTPEMKKKAIEQAKKAQEKNLTKRLGLRIAELKRACDLSDQQVRRLQLAAKGAVKNELKDFETKIQKMQQQMMNGFFVDDDAEEGIVAQAANAALEAIGIKKDDKSKDVADKPQRKEDKEVARFRKELSMMYGPMEMMLSGAGSARIEEQKLWRVQLRKTLTEEQLSKHQQLLTSRKAYKRKAAIMGIVAGFDARLLMTDQQREQMTKLVDKQLGKFLEAVPENQPAYVMESLEDLSSTQSAYRRVRKAAKDFLNEEQYSEFKKRSQDQWEQFGMLWGMMDGGMAMAAPMAAEMVEVPEDAGYLGVQLSQHPDGVELLVVTDKLAAAKAGLKVGDVVTAVDGKEVSVVSDLIETIAETKPEQKVKLSIVRDGEKSEIEVTLGSRQAVTPE